MCSIPKLSLLVHTCIYAYVDEKNISQEGHGKKDGYDRSEQGSRRRKRPETRESQRDAPAPRRLDGIVNSGEELLNFSKRRSPALLLRLPSLFLAPISAGAASFPLSSSLSRLTSIN